MCFKGDWHVYFVYLFRTQAETSCIKATFSYIRINTNFEKAYKISFIYNILQMKSMSKPIF